MCMLKCACFPAFRGLSSLVFGCSANTTKEKRTLLAGNAHALLHMNEGFVKGVEGLSTCTWRQARLCFDSVSCCLKTKWMKSKYKKAR